jgi:hypothetical protein
MVALSRFLFCVLALAAISPLTVQTARGQLSKGNQIIMNRGFQVQALASTYDTFHLSAVTNANYTTVNWLWIPPRSYDGSMPLLGPAPGFPWARWVSDESDMPPQGDEADYTNQLVLLQLSDEPNLDDSSVRARFANWLNSVRTNWPNTILSVNTGGGISDGNLIDFVNTARPDMITFDVYPWRSVYDVNQPNHTGPAIPGPPTLWYTVLRINRDISHAFGIPYGSYVQTFHAVEDYDSIIYRDPSPSELRLNHSGALAFDAKLLIDFHYNNGSSPLFYTPGGDSYPTPLYYEKADIALRCRNFGKATARLRPVAEGTTSCGNLTTSVMFIRGRNSSGGINPIPSNFCAGSGGNPYTDWSYQRNDAYLTNTWTVANKGTKNNGQPGDVIVSWFNVMDESFDGPTYSNEVYMMVVNGLSDPTGSAADCLQEITLNFAPGLPGGTVDMMNPLTGLIETWQLPLVNGFRQLRLNLNGGDAALFKFSDGSPFVGTSFTNSPLVIQAQPQSVNTTPGTAATFSVVTSGSGPLSYQWQVNGVAIAGATTNSYALANVQPGDMGNYTVVVTGPQGSITSSVAALVVDTMILYEPFNYTNFGGSVSDNTPSNWTLSGTATNDFDIAPGNLSYPGLRPSIGNSATNGGDGVGVRRLLGSTVNTGVIYFSVLFDLVSYGGWSGAPTTNGAQACAFTSTDNTSFRLQAMVKSNTPSTYLAGVQKGGTGSTITFSPTPVALGSTALLVGKYDFTQNPNVATLWINPITNNFGGAEPGSGFITATTGTNNLPIDRFNFRQNVLNGPSSSPGSMQWDELRVGARWADVTPAPVVLRIVSTSMLPDGRFKMQVSANVPNIVIESSTNLENWSNVGTLASATGLFEYTEAATAPKRFLRARLP